MYMYSYVCIDVLSVCLLYVSMYVYVHVFIRMYGCIFRVFVVCMYVCICVYVLDLYINTSEDSLYQNKRSRSSEV